MGNEEHTGARNLADPRGQADERDRASPCAPSPGEGVTSEATAEPAGAVTVTCVSVPHSFPRSDVVFMKPAGSAHRAPGRSCSGDPSLDRAPTWGRPWPPALLPKA